MDSPLTFFALGSVATLIAFLLAYFKHQSITSQWKRAFALAEEIVPAVEQLAETGQIDKSQKLATVMAELKVHSPGLEEKHLRWAVEKAVYWMKNNSYVNLEQLEGSIELIEDGTARLTGGGE